VHYLRDVLRLRVGGKFVAVLPGGAEGPARLEPVGETLGARLIELHPGAARPPVQVLLYAALLKHKGFELLLEKCTEVGAAEIVPVLTDRVVVEPRPERLAAQVERWNRITEAAGRQCQSPSVPPVREPLEWPAALAHWQAQGVPGIIFALPAEGPLPPLREVLSDLRGADRLALFIGPEGDFTPAEVAAGLAAGLRPASLGDRVLRAETAAVVATALVVYDLAADRPTPPSADLGHPSRGGRGLGEG
jgi:16S rRNA (uracil1498-N3)-methyltransferase